MLAVLVIAIHAVGCSNTDTDPNAANTSSTPTTATSLPSAAELVGYEGAPPGTVHLVICMDATGSVGGDGVRAAKAALVEAVNAGADKLPMRELIVDILATVPEQERYRDPWIEFNVHGIGPMPNRQRLVDYIEEFSGADGLPDGLDELVEQANQLFISYEEEQERLDSQLAELASMIEDQIRYDALHDSTATWLWACVHQGSTILASEEADFPVLVIISDFGASDLPEVPISLNRTSVQVVMNCSQFLEEDQLSSDYLVRCDDDLIDFENDLEGLMPASIQRVALSSWTLPNALWPGG